MRIEKYIYICLAALALVACSKGGAEGETPFTSAQAEAVAAFSGVWLDHGNSNLSEAESAYLLPDPDRLEFGQLFPGVVDLSRPEDAEGVRLVCGEAVYVSNAWEPVSVPVYFYVTPKADYLVLYRRDRGDLPVYMSGDLEMKGTARFIWKASAGMPYDFRKK